MAEELAVAYLSLVPTLKGARSAIDKELSGSEMAAATASAGDRIGGLLGRNIADSAGGGLSSLKVAATGALAAFGGNQVLKTLRGFADSYADAAKEALKFQRVTGASAEDASRLAVVAQQTGLSTDMLASSLVRLSRSSQSSGGQSALKQLGVDMEDAQGNARPLTNVLTDLAARFSQLPNGVEKNALALQLFGRSGADLLPLLNRGAEGIDAIVAKADELGLTLGQDDLDSVKAYTAAQRDLQLTMASFRQSVGAEVFPLLTSGLQTAANVATTANEAFQSLPAPLREGAVALAAIGAVGAVAFGAGGVLIGGVRAAVSQWKALGGSIQTAGAAAATAEGDLAGAADAASSGGEDSGFAGGLGKIAGIATATIAVSQTVFSWLNEVNDVAGRVEDAGNKLSIARSNMDQSAGLDAFGEAVDAEQARLGFTKLWEEIGAEVDLVGTGIKGDVENVQRAFDSLDPENAAYVLSVLEAATAKLDPNSRQYAINTEFIERNRASLDLAAEATAATAGETDGLTGSLEGAAAASNMLSGGLQKLQALSRFAGAGLELARARADAFGAALDGASSMDDMLSSSLSLGQGLQEFRKGLVPAADETEDLASASDLAAESQTKLRDALERTDPALAANRIALDANAAAGDAFSRSMSQGFEGATVGSALDLGDAFAEFRRTVRQMPKDIDLAGAALNRYGKLQDEGIRNLLALGSATREYLANLLKQGESTGAVTAEADRLREAYRQQLAALGLNEAQMEEYLKLLGITPKQVTTAMELSQVEKSRFELNAYLGLLDGKIPAEVTSQVTAKIETGDLKGAANILAQFAKTNPVRLDTKVDGPDESELKKVRDSIQFALPATIDVGKVLRGEYDEKQLAGIAKAQDLAKAAAESLRALVQSGAGQQEVLAKAAELRGVLGGVFAEAGASQTAINDLFTAAGLQDTQIQFAITMSGEAEAIAKIQLLNDLLGDDNKPTPGVQRDIAVKIAAGDLEGAAEMMARWVQDSQDGLITDPLLVHLASPDVAAADSGLAAFRTAQGEQVISLNAGVTIAPIPPPSEWPIFGGGNAGQAEIPVGANTTPADRGLAVWRQLTGQAPPTPTAVGANTAPASGDVSAFKAATLAAPPIEIPAKVKVSLDDGSWKNVIGIITGARPEVKPKQAQGLDGMPILFPGGPYPPGRDGDTRTRYATGGLVEGPRRPKDSVLVRLTGLEYVVRDDVVAKPGVLPMLEQLNAGRLPGFAEGGLVDVVPIRVPPAAPHMPAAAPVELGDGAGGGDSYTIAPVYQMAGQAPRALDLPELIRTEKYLRRKARPVLAAAT